MDGLVASVDRVINGVVHRALDVRPLELVPCALPRDVAVGDAVAVGDSLLAFT